MYVLTRENINILTLTVISLQCRFRTNLGLVRETDQIWYGILKGQD
jgi:hypothetical protein